MIKGYIPIKFINSLIANKKKSYIFHKFINFLNVFNFIWNYVCYLRESRGLSSACSVERGTGVGPAQTFLSPETPPPASATSTSTYRRLDDRPSRELHERIQEITVQR